MAHRPSYATILRDAEQARWALDEGTAGLIDLELNRPFLPESLVHTTGLRFLDDNERLILNQIRGHAYLGIWALGERFIVPFVMSQASRSSNTDEEEFLALMGVGQRAAKHLVTFKRFAEACERGFDAELGTLGSPGEALARFLTRDTLAMGVLALHLACTTQPHSLRAMRSAEPLSETFRRLLQLHWREECQTVRVLERVVRELVREASQHQRERGFEQYEAMLDDISASFRTQAELDLRAFEQNVRPLSEPERDEWREMQGQSYDEVFIHLGVKHPILRRTMTELVDHALPALDEAAKRFSVTPREAAS